MIKRSLIYSAVFIFAFAVLFISVLKAAEVKYSFKLVNANSTDINNQLSKDLEGMKIDYYLPTAGTVLPDSPFWILKALRDRLWLLITTNDIKKADLMILFADKRLVAAEILFNKKEYNVGFTTLSKAEKYLEEASNLEETIRGKGEDTTALVTTLVKASLKHRQIIKELLLITPNDGKSNIVLIENLTRGVFNTENNILFGKGIAPIPDPFSGQ